MTRSTWSRSASLSSLVWRKRTGSSCSSSPEKLAVKPLCGVAVEEEPVLGVLGDLCEHLRAV